MAIPSSIYVFWASALLIRSETISTGKGSALYANPIKPSGSWLPLLLHYMQISSPASKEYASGIRPRLFRQAMAAAMGISDTVFDEYKVVIRGKMELESRWLLECQ